MMEPSDQKHILAMNESDDVLKLFRELLEDEGYRVTMQPYLDKDLGRIEVTAPDLILLDYMWAGDDAGWALLQMLKLHPATSQIPILLCTGAVKQVEGLKTHLHDMQVRVIYKPFNIEELTREVAAALEAAAPEPEHLAGSPDVDSLSANTNHVHEHGDPVVNA
ncbi:MAG TPA: response regulator [Thermomicrobiales bacterium]|nr:response regulator [Thermomicrobiales bacterium]